MVQATVHLLAYFLQAIVGHGGFVSRPAHAAIVMCRMAFAPVRLTESACGGAQGNSVAGMLCRVVQAKPVGRMTAVKLFCGFFCSKRANEKGRLLLSKRPSNLVAGTGFEPVTFGLCARRAARLLHPASEEMNYMAKPYFVQAPRK